MVKKKGRSKRVTLQDKYKIQKRVLETHRKRRKEAKLSALTVGNKKNKSKDPGIPNSWPFKQELLKEIQQSRERDNQRKLQEKELRKQQKLLNGTNSTNEEEEEEEDDDEELEDEDEVMMTDETEEMTTSKSSKKKTTSIQDLMDSAAIHGAAFEARQQQQQLKGNHTSNQKGETGNDGNNLGQLSRRAYLRELKKVIDQADVILQVLDARDPIGTRIHPSMEDVILSHSHKRMVLVLNKIDLVPKSAIAGWLTYLRQSRPTIAIMADPNYSNQKKIQHIQNKEDKEGSTTSSTTATAAAASASDDLGMEGLLQLLKNYARTGGSSGGKSNKTTIVVGVIGYPNTGKSSIINALKRTRVVGVSPRPGFTTSIQEVVLDRTVRLLDSPGVVFDDDTALLGNCVNPDTIDDPIPSIAALLKRCAISSLMMTYNIPAFPPGDVMMFLAMIAKVHGRVLKGGIPDKIAAARAVLKDWNMGKIPYYTIPPKVTNEINTISTAGGGGGTASSSTHSSAIIVSQLSPEFDLSQFDEQILSRLEDNKDEMDFVQLVNNPKSISTSSVTSNHTTASEYSTTEIVQYLTDNNTDDNTTSHMEE